MPFSCPAHAVATIGCDGLANEVTVRPGARVTAPGPTWIVFDADNGLFGDHAKVTITDPSCDPAAAASYDVAVAHFDSDTVGQALNAPNGDACQIFNAKIVGGALVADVRVASLDRTVTLGSGWPSDDFAPPHLDLRLLGVQTGAPPIATVELTEDGSLRHVFDLPQSEAEAVQLYTNEAIAVTATSLGSGGGSGVFALTKCLAFAEGEEPAGPARCADCPDGTLCDPEAAQLGTPKCVQTCRVDDDCASAGVSACCNTYSNGVEACTVAHCPG